MNIPSKLTNDPVVETVIEIRFDSVLPSDAVFGVFYSVLRDIFPEYKNLPVLQVPENIRSNDPNLRFAPLYALMKGNFQFNIGGRVASLVTKNPYSGWDAFSTLAIECFEKIKSTGVIKSIDRFGLRYINFFEEKIFDKLNMSINTPFENDPFAKNITLHHLNNGFTTKILIADNAQQVANNLVRKGSIIDIDTYSEGQVDFFSNISEMLNRAHDEEKTCFFSLLKNDFVSELGPIYE